MSSGSVTIRYRRLQEGDLAAADWLWRRYGPELVQLARIQLKGTPRTMSDEEDVVQNVFSDFYQGVAEGQFDNVEGRRDLWGLLANITARKAANQRKYHRRIKRRNASTTAHAELDPRNVPGSIADTEPSPEMRTEMKETLVRMIECLKDPTLKDIATWILEGCSQDEIAQRLNCVPRTVRRKLQLIRTKWLAESHNEH